jgi:hypothetical protein
MKTVTAYENGDARRITLPAPTWSGNDNIGTGMFRHAVYVGARSKRVVVETYSQWEDRGNPGCGIGTEYEIVTDEDHLARLAGEYEEVADALEQAGILTAETL